MPLLYSGSGRYSGGSGRCEPLCTKVVRPPPPPSLCEEGYIGDTQDSAAPEDEASPGPGPAAAPAPAPPGGKKRKFSFKHGKISVTETEAPAALGQVYLEVQGREIEVSEDCLASNSHHFCRILEDISTNTKSEYLVTDTQEEEEDEDDTFSSVSFDSVSTVMDFITQKIPELELSEESVGSVQQVARLLGISNVEKLCKKFVRTGVSTDNCFARFSLADSFMGWADTASIIQTFIEFHFSDIVTNNLAAFCETITEVQLKRILGSGGLHTRSEDEVAAAAVAWLEHDPASRAQWAWPLLEELQYHCLSGLEAVARLRARPIITEDSHCLEMLDQAEEYHSLGLEDKLLYWAERGEARPSRWPQLLVCLSYAEKTLQSYDFSTQGWAVLTETQDWVFGAELAVCDRRLFTLGGVASRQVAVYCPEADTWAPASYPGLRRQRLGHGSCVAPSQHGGLIYAGGGSAEVGGAGHRDLEWVEPGLPNECDCTLCGPTDHITWQLASNKMSIPRTFGAMAAVSVEGACAGEHVVVCVAGDQDPDTRVSSVELYSSRRGTWSQGPSTRTRRDCCRLAVVGEHVYAVGGYNTTDNKILSSCERFSLRTGKWEEAGKLRVARRSPGVVSYRGVVYAVGGMGSKRDLSSLEQLCPVTGRWRLLGASMPGLSGWCSAAVIDKPVRMM